MKRRPIVNNLPWLKNGKSNESKSTNEPMFLDSAESQPSTVMTKRMKDLELKKQKFMNVPEGLEEFNPLLKKQQNQNDIIEENNDENDDDFVISKPQHQPVRQRPTNKLSKNEPSGSMSSRSDSKSRLLDFLNAKRDIFASEKPRSQSITSQTSKKPPKDLQFPKPSSADSNMNEEENDNPSIKVEKQKTPDYEPSTFSSNVKRRIKTPLTDVESPPPQQSRLAPQPQQPPSARKKIIKKENNYNRDETPVVVGEPTADIEGIEKLETLVDQNQGEAFREIELVPCPICGKSFSKDRIEKHQKVCISQQKKKNQKKATFDIRKKLLPEELQQEKYSIDKENKKVTQMTRKKPAPNATTTTTPASAAATGKNAQLQNVFPASRVPKWKQQSMALRSVLEKFKTKKPGEEDDPAVEDIQELDDRIVCILFFFVFFFVVFLTNFFFFFRNVNIVEENLRKMLMKSMNLFVRMQRTEQLF